LEQSSAALALPAAAIQKQLAAWGKTVGAPWRQDEKLAAIAAWVTLAKR
jgi:hypothetical protein